MVDTRKTSSESPSSTPAVRTSWWGWGRYPCSHHAAYRSVSRRKEDRKEGKLWLLQLSYVSALKKTSCSQRPTMRKTFPSCSLAGCFKWENILSANASTYQEQQGRNKMKERRRLERWCVVKWLRRLYNGHQKARKRQALNYNENNRRQRQNTNVQRVSGPMSQSSYSQLADGEN